MARILLVDDDEDMRFTVTQMLGLDRHHVTAACNGQDALQRFGQATFDLVITDVLMPEMDGAEFTARLREIKPSQPIIAMSGGRRVLSPEFNLQTARLAGANLQLAKPFSVSQLRNVVDQMLAQGTAGSSS